MDQYGDFILEDYQLCDEDLAGSTKYYGYRDRDGDFYIRQYNSTAGTHRYFRGPSADYTTRWAGRAGLTYQYFNDVF